LTAPLRLSIFGESGDAARRTEYQARKDRLDRSLAAQIASQIPAAGLQGSWAVPEDGEQTDEAPLDLYPQKIFFGEHDFQKGVFEHLESRGTYTIDARNQASWSLRFQFPHKDVTPAVAQWLNKDEIKLVLENGDSTLVLKRIASDQESPFKTEEQLQQAGEGTKGPTGGHPAQKKPNTSTESTPGGGRPSQP
jgi:hypothetical protein